MTAGDHKPIWSKRSGVAPSARMLAYCAGRDVAGRPPCDAELIPYDIWTNRAHCRMLARGGMISGEDLTAILEALDELEAWLAEGRFTLDPDLEDVHINIERHVARCAGEAPAGVMHTARSRNDQSATDMRMWLRDRLLERARALADLVEVLAAFAARHAETLAPGWTHGQPAMPTTLGHWAAAHAWALARDGEALRGLWPLLNSCPLGAAASFGTSWPIDRELTAQLLGFDAPQRNSLDCISARGEMEARLAHALAPAMTHVSALGQDLIFLSSPPRSLIRLGEAHVTGSSIMPNKRNPDFAEVTRSRALAVHGLAGNLTGVGRGALSGYNRDTQWTKYWIMDLLWEVGEAPELFAEVLGALEVDAEACRRAAVEGFSVAADLADHLARTRGMPFRRAYHLVAECVRADEAAGGLMRETVNAVLGREGIEPPLDADEATGVLEASRAIGRRVSAGGPAPDDVRAQAVDLSAAAQGLGTWCTERADALEQARARCRAG